MSTKRTTGEWSIVARQQAAVAHVGQLGLRGATFDELISTALDAVSDGLASDSATLFELAADWRSFTVRGASVDGHVILGNRWSELRVPAGRDSLPGYTVMQGVGVESPDLLDDQRFRASGPDFDMNYRSAVAAPVGWGERPWGVLAAYTAEPRAWTEDDVHFVQSLANTVGLAIYRSDAERALVDSSARLELSLSAGGLGSWEWEFAPDVIELSATAARLLGAGDDVTTLTGDQFLDLVHPDDRVALRGRSYEMLATGGDHHALYRTVHADGQVRWLESWGRVPPSQHEAQRLVGVVGDITERRQTEETKEALLAAEQAARVSAEHVRERLLLLAELSSTLMATLDPDAVIRAFPHFCVPQLADVCLVDLVDDTGTLVETAATAWDDDALADVRALRKRRAEIGSGGRWSERVVATTGERVLVPRLTDDDYRKASADDDHLALQRRFGAVSSIVVPLNARGRVVGVLTLLTTAASDRSYDHDDLALAQEMADRVALAHDNGRLYASRNRVARTLQAALLPPALPSIPGLDLGARYRVAEDELEIGGDFYDVMETDDGSWGVVVGDVCGRGPDAAALTGLMRHSIRAAVVREQLPSRVLAQTNDAVLDQIDDARFCTATFLRLRLGEPGSPVHVQASSAGHPRPILLRADGRVEVVPSQGVLLGVVPSPKLVDIDLVLDPGDAVVVYTDGIIEARRDADQFGEERLLDALRPVAERRAEEIAAAVMDAVEAFAVGASDDRAVLVLRVDPA